MTNIPTDLLRTLIAVVDLRSFTKAAFSLGVTQPAVSAQIKRLQSLLGCEVFDRSSQGVSLTPQGEKVVAHARRLLSINDQIVAVGDPKTQPESVLRVGAPGDFVASVLTRQLAQFREQRPGVRFNVRMGTYEPLIRDLRQGDLDLAICLSATPPIDARHYWSERMAWARSESTKVDMTRPVPLVSYGDKSLNRFLAVTALKNAGLEWEDVFTGPSLLSLAGAVVSGLGVMVLSRRRARAIELIPWDDGPLPKLIDMYCGIYIREAGERDALEQLADSVANALRPDGDSPMVLEDAFKPPINMMRNANTK